MDETLRKQTAVRTVARILLYSILAVALATLAACGDDSSGSSPSTGDDSLGTVTVTPEEAIQIRSLNTITGDVAYLGIPNQRGVELAVADFGPIHGFDVNLGAGLDEFCSSDGGQAAAQTIVADQDVVGVIGTSCSVAATAAAPLITNAGMTMIAPSNTSPLLTRTSPETLARTTAPATTVRRTTASMWERPWP